MFTAVATLITGILASSGFKVAEFVAPYAIKATPFVALVVAALVGYYHGDLVARICLGLVAVNELIVAAIINNTFDSK